MPAVLCKVLPINSSSSKPQPPNHQPTMSRPTTSLPLSSGPSFTPQPRSSTHPAKPRHHHIPHHPHRTHHHHHHDKSVPQSAIQPTSSNPFGEFLAKQTSKIDGFQTPPREREQQQLQQQQREEIAREQKVKEDAERERATWKEVERSRTSRKAADEYAPSALPIPLLYSIVYRLYKS